MKAILTKLGVLLGTGIVLVAFCILADPLTTPSLMAEAPKWPDVDTIKDKICDPGGSCQLCPAQKQQTYGCTSSLPSSWRS